MSWLACLALPAVWAPVFCGVQLVFLVSEERQGGSVFSVVKHVKGNTVHSWTKHRLLEADLFSQGPTSNNVQNGTDQRWAPHPCVVLISFKFRPRAPYIFSDFQRKTLTTTRPNVSQDLFRFPRIARRKRIFSMEKVYACHLRQAKSQALSHNPASPSNYCI